MAGGTLGRVTRTDKTINAEQYNRVLRVGDKVNAQPRDLSRRVVEALTDLREALFAPAVNIGASRLNPFDVCAIVGESKGVSQLGTLLRVQTAVLDSDVQKVAIVADSFDSNQSGLVCISGIYWAKTDGISVGDFAQIAVGSLIATRTTEGPMQVLAQNAAGDRILVRFPFGGGGSGTVISQTLTEIIATGWFINGS